MKFFLPIISFFLLNISYALDSNENFDDIKLQDPSDLNVNKKTLELLKKSNLTSSNPYEIDYNTLSLSYYPYMDKFDKYYDSDIKKLIDDVIYGRERTGLFLSLGWNIASYSNLNINNLLGLQSPFKGSPISFVGFNTSFGFQTFSSLVFYPNLVGYRYYLQYLQSFLDAKITSVSLNADLLIDLSYGRSKAFANGLILGLGFGSSSLNNAPFDLSLNANLGFSFSFLYHQKLEITSKILVGDFIGFIPTIGYSYVF